MKKIEFLNTNYILEKDYKDAFNEEEFLEKCTDYFLDFDYIVGDYSYDKLRLKGFRDKENKANKINDILNLENYLNENCAFECRYFVLRKEK